MIVYNSDVVNAIARYEAKFNYKIGGADITDFQSEKAFVDKVNSCINSNNPLLGGKAQRRSSSLASKPTMKLAKEAAVSRIAAFDKKYGFVDGKPRKHSKNTIKSTKSTNAATKKTRTRTHKSKTSS